jgi:hypothetical protein
MLKFLQILVLLNFDKNITNYITKTKLIKKNITIILQ